MCFGNTYMSTFYCSASITNSKVILRTVIIESEYRSRNSVRDGPLNEEIKILCITVISHVIEGVSRMLLEPHLNQMNFGRHMERLKSAKDQEFQAPHDEAKLCRQCSTSIPPAHTKLCACVHDKTPRSKSHRARTSASFGKV